MTKEDLKLERLNYITSNASKKERVYCEYNNKEYMICSILDMFNLDVISIELFDETTKECLETWISLGSDDIKSLYTK